MFSATAYVIRSAGAADEHALARHASLVGEPPLSGTVLVGELAGSPAAAVSVVDGRVVADPFRPTSRLLVHLRARARAQRALERTPSLRDRIRAGVRFA